MPDITTSLDDEPRAKTGVPKIVATASFEREASSNFSPLAGAGRSLGPQIGAHARQQRAVSEQLGRLRNSLAHLQKSQ